MSGGIPLCAEERETISRELCKNTSTRQIGRLLGRHHSTIADEISRNGDREHYRACAAQERYESLKARPKERKLVTSSRLHDAVNEGLEQKWSPEQISASTRPLCATRRQGIEWRREGAVALGEAGAGEIVDLGLVRSPGSARRRQPGPGGLLLPRFRVRSGRGGRSG
jgi:Helix-turn-helix domain